MREDLVPTIRNRMPWRGADETDLEPLLSREWLVTNGLGGYASGTVSGAATRRYHGLLVAALPGPLGRVMMLNHLMERAVLPDGTVAAWAARSGSAATCNCTGPAT
jgi:glycogen debranching enzyme